MLNFFVINYISEVRFIKNCDMYFAYKTYVRFPLENNEFRDLNIT